MQFESNFLFHVPFASEQVDEVNKIIRGVSLMTGDLEAEGHDLHVDDTTLSQIFEWARRRGKVTVKADHKGADGKTFKAIVGYLTNFRQDTGSKKVRGDLELLHSEPLTPKILEMAKKMPENFGLSAAFKGKGVKGVGGKSFARCSKLLAVDLVENPAANPDGLFSAVRSRTGGEVDSGKRSMDPNSSTPAAEPTIADVLAALNKQNETLSAIGTRLQAVEDFQQQVTQGMNEPDLAELANMTDEELDQAGFDVAKVRAAVQDAIDAGELTPEGGAPAGSESGNAPAGTPGNGAAATAATGAALSKRITDIVQFEIGKVRKQAREAAEAEEAEQSFQIIEEKVTALAQKNDEQAEKITQLEAENKALKLAVKTGVRTVAPGVESQVLFNEKAPEGSFEKLVADKATEFGKKPNMTELKAQSEAISFVIRTNPVAYQEYRTRGGKIELAAK